MAPQPRFATDLAQSWHQEHKSLAGDQNMPLQLPTQGRTGSWHKPWRS